MTLEANVPIKSQDFRISRRLDLRPKVLTNGVQSGKKSLLNVKMKKIFISLHCILLITKVKFFQATEEWQKS